MKTILNHLAEEVTNMRLNFPVCILEREKNKYLNDRVIIVP